MSQSQLSAGASALIHPRFAGRQDRPARRATPPALRVVPAAIRESGNGAFALLCMGLLGLGLVALLMMNTALASGIYQLKGLQRTSGTLTDQQEQLTQAVDALRSPANLAARAQAMGMVPAKSMAFIRLTDGTIVGVAQPAAESQRLNVVSTPTVPPPAPPPAPATAPSPAATPTP